MYIAHIFDHDLYGRTDGLNVRVNGGHTTLGAVTLAAGAWLNHVAAAMPFDLVMG